MRVVSLLPSATEILCAVGGERLLVGRSHECDFPGSIQGRPVLTSQKTHADTSAAIDAQVREAFAQSSEDAGRSLYRLDTDLLRSLRPDVILTQDLCDVCSIDLNTVRAAAANLSPAPVIVSLNPASLEDVFDDLLRVGEAVDLANDAQTALVRLRERYWSARECVNPYVDGPETAFLEWMDPLFAAGHWTPQMIHEAGGRHSLNPPGTKSRPITAEELLASRPERLIICPCGYGLEAIRRELPRMQAQTWWPELPAVRSGRVALVDGSQMFNRPGPRLIDAFEWLVGWINDRPEMTPAGFPFEAAEPERRPIPAAAGSAAAAARRA